MSQRAALYLFRNDHKISQAEAGAVIDAFIQGGETGVEKHDLFILAVDHKLAPARTVTEMIKTLPNLISGDGMDTAIPFCLVRAFQPKAYNVNETPSSLAEEDSKAALKILRLIARRYPNLKSEVDDQTKFVQDLAEKSRKASEALDAEIAKINQHEAEMTEKLRQVKFSLQADHPDLGETGEVIVMADTTGATPEVVKAIDDCYVEILTLDSISSNYDPLNMPYRCLITGWTAWKENDAGFSGNKALGETRYYQVLIVKVKYGDHLVKKFYKGDALSILHSLAWTL